MKPINALIVTFELTKTGTLATTFQKTSKEENMHVWFGYWPLIICNHTREKVLGSMKSNPINMIHTSKISSIEGLNEYTEGYFRKLNYKYLTNK